MKKIPKFMPGMELNRKFYHEVVGPLMKQKFPKLKYSAALIGNGSDVVGFDDPTSMDHNWGPRMRLILPERNFKKTKKEVDEMLRYNLPLTFLGYPTNYTEEADNYIKQQMLPVDKGPVNHLIRFYTVKSFFKHYLGFDPYKKITIEDWLTFPEQALLEITGGEVFYDELNLNEMREKFGYYPKDVWFYMLWVQWGRMMNEIAYHVRSAKHGDELGSRLIAARMVRRIVKMAFLIERQYAPYVKWYGSAFQKLPAANKLEPLLLTAVKSNDWKERQKAMTEAHKVLGHIHNQKKITKPLPVRSIDFHKRGYKVFDVGHYITALQEAIKDPKVRNIKYHLGAVDQFIDHARINHEDYVFRKLKSIIK